MASERARELSILQSTSQGVHVALLKSRRSHVRTRGIGLVPAQSVWTPRESLFEEAPLENAASKPQTVKNNGTRSANASDTVPPQLWSEPDSDWKLAVSSSPDLISRSKKALVWGTRVHGEQRVITLHPVASGCFTKPDTGGQGGGRSGVGEHGNKRQ
ncbi:hypothetical protein Q8A73_008540 [Channa argus]|nr:hypothetical protein Q8A73_008540 [Channa argus]